ncbi:MAG: alpha/beta fold hydrolase [Alphaproteobacteria bacterium]|nr:alpha/beta fold hydrolase [Alphaproteobacteria bacterium]MCB9691924.1 alpha/beta fold hydrolase [Alphaproteobacteria bacterium]
MRRLLLILLGGIAVGYLSIVGLVYVLQDRLLFPAFPIPREELDAWATAWELEQVEVTGADGTRILVMHRPAGGERAVIFHHGNGGGIQSIAAIASYLPGVDVYSFSYRSYPGSDPVPPSEAGLIADARAVWDHVTQVDHIPPERIVLHGQSLGGGVVHGLLMEVTPKAVVFDSTFTSAVDVARRQYAWLPVDLLMRNRFPSAERAPRVKAPVLLLHGTDDHFIPFAHAERLAALLPDARLMAVPGRGHDDWLLDQPEVQAAYRAFVSSQIGP